MEYRPPKPPHASASVPWSSHFTLIFLITVAMSIRHIKSSTQQVQHNQQHEKKKTLLKPQRWRQLWDTSMSAHPASFPVRFKNIFPGLTTTNSWQKRGPSEIERHDTVSCIQSAGCQQLSVLTAPVGSEFVIELHAFSFEWKHILNSYSVSWLYKDTQTWQLNSAVKGFLPDDTQPRHFRLVLAGGILPKISKQKLLSGLNFSEQSNKSQGYEVDAEKKKIETILSFKLRRLSNAECLYEVKMQRGYRAHTQNLCCCGDKLHIWLQALLRCLFGFILWCMYCTVLKK